MTTNAAKAAAVLHHISSIDSRHSAVELYDALEANAQSNDALSQVLEDFEAPIWEPLEQYDATFIWDQIWCLAQSIDRCFEELK